MRAPDLYVESQAAKQLVEVLAGWDEADITLAIESECNLNEALAVCIIRLNELAEHEAACKRLANGYRDRAAALDIAQERVRDAMLNAVQRAGVPLPVRLPEGTITVSNPAPSARVIDEAQIPAAYIRVREVRSPDMASITRTLREGLEVPGAVLGNAKSTLVLRTIK
jgi:hypothetical protein